MTDLESVRRALSQERATVLESLGFKADVFSRSGPIAEEDQAQTSYDEFVALTINTIDYAKLRQVNDALARLNAGEYGVCQYCDEPIPPKRLAAIPWARYCVPCQEELAVLAEQQGQLEGESPEFAA